MTDPTSNSASAPRLARPFVALLIAAMIASAVFVLEPWPLTSFRLFSHLRYDQQSAWQATIVRTGGRESDYPLDSLPQGVRGFNVVMAEFATADTARRDELCRAWVAAAPGLVDRDPVELRLYLRSWQLSERSGDRALPGTREHSFTCTGDGADVVGGGD